MRVDKIFYFNWLSIDYKLCFSYNAARHWVLYHRIGIESFQISMGFHLEILIHSFPLTFHRIQGFALLYRLIWSMGIQLIGSLAVEPGISTTET
ncbi:hypothetical protein ES703_93021 [subsurface metagenome]